MNKILKLIEFYNNINFNLDNTRQSIWYDIYNFMHTHKLIRKRVNINNIDNFYNLQFRRRLRKSKVKTKEEKKIYINPVSPKEWHNGFNIEFKTKDNIENQDSYEFKVLYTNVYSITFSSNKQAFNNIILHYTENDNIERISLNDLYLINKTLDENNKHGCNIDMFNGIYIELVEKGKTFDICIYYTKEKEEYNRQKRIAYNVRLQTNIIDIIDGNKRLYLEEQKRLRRKNIKIQLIVAYIIHILIFLLTIFSLGIVSHIIIGLLCFGYLLYTIILNNILYKKEIISWIPCINFSLVTALSTIFTVTFNIPLIATTILLIIINLIYYIILKEKRY